jgi:transcriptional regulator with XRE-family HTH domain
MRSKLDLRELIERKYGTYEALGREIGITKQAVSNVVNGRATSPTTRYAISAALGVDADLIEWPAAKAA